MPSLEMPSGAMNPEDVTEPVLPESIPENGSQPTIAPMPFVMELSTGSAEPSKIDEPAGEWTRWQDLNGVCITSPAAASWGMNRLDVFVIGTSSQLYHKWWDGSKWSNWIELDGSTCIGKPAAVSWGENRLDVFAIGIDKQVYHKWWDGSKWNGWENRDGTCIHGIAATSWGEGRIDLFAVGTNSVVYHKYFADDKWENWRPLKLKNQDDWEKSSTSICAPAAVASKPGRIDIFTLGIDNDVYHAWGDGETWEGWCKLGGPAIQGVAAASRSENCLDLFTISTDVEETDNHLYHRVMKDDQWSAWENLGGVCASAPAAVAMGSDRVDAFVVGTRSKLWQKTWTKSALGVLTTPSVLSLSKKAQRIKQVAEDKNVKSIDWFSQGLSIPKSRRADFFINPDEPEYYVGGMCHALALYWMAFSLNDQKFLRWIIRDDGSLNERAADVIISETILYKNRDGVRDEFTGETNDELDNGFLRDWNIIPSTGSDAKTQKVNEDAAKPAFDMLNVAKTITKMLNRGYMLGFSGDTSGHALAAHSTLDGEIKFFDANYGEFIFGKSKDFEAFFIAYMDVSKYSEKYRNRWSVRRYKRK